MGTQFDFRQSVVLPEQGKIVIPVRANNADPVVLIETDEQIFEAMAADSTFGLVKGAPESLRNTVPLVRQACEEHGWSLKVGIEQIGMLFHARILGGAAATIARATRYDY